jgi:hypothetical protein
VPQQPALFPGVGGSGNGGDDFLSGSLARNRSVSRAPGPVSMQVRHPEDRSRPTRKEPIMTESQTPSLHVPNPEGPRFEVASVPLVAPVRAGPQAVGVGARLCGGTSTCITLIRIDPDPL